MDVSSVFGSLTGSSPVGNKRQEPEATGNASAGAPLKAPVAVQADNAAFREILAHFDVSQISPREFSEMVRELDSAGLLSEGERQELASMRLEMEQAGLDADNQVDLLGFFQDKLREEERQLGKLEDKLGENAALSRENSLAGTLRQLDWVKKFALLQQAKDYRPIDATA